jgi:hypothetical protein
MDSPLPPSIRDLFAEDDPLRVVIRAHAGLERYVTMAIQSRFVGYEWPKDLSGLGFRQRLALAVALGLVLPSAVPPIQAFAGLRNKLSHGNDAEVEISDQTARAVFDSCSDWFDESALPELRAQPVVRLLQFAAASCYLQVAESVRRAEETRSYAEAAVEKARAAEPKLSLEDIEKLLRETDDDETG